MAWPGSAVRMCQRISVVVSSMKRAQKTPIVAAAWLWQCYLSWLHGWELVFGVCCIHIYCMCFAYIYIVKHEYTYIYNVLCILCVILCVCCLCMYTFVLLHVYIYIQYTHVYTCFICSILIDNKYMMYVYIYICILGLSYV